MASVTLRNSNNSFKTILIVTLLAFAGLGSVKAQEFRNSQYRYFGLEANFGMKTSALESDVEAINNMSLAEEGGSIGLVLGNQAVKGRMQVAGFYYSNSSVKHTVNMVESALQLNVYPLKFINKSRQALNPYVSGGVDYSTLKFFGYYNNPEGAKKINYSSSSAPFIGKIASTRGTVGAGIEWRLAQVSDFVHLFAEAKYSFAMAQDADEFFKNTKVSNSTSINIGVSFGWLR
jgi:hypothetical protein